jgi:hypothetical protein
MDKDKELLELCRAVIDIKTEKKTYNKDMNERIKELETQIKALVRDDTYSLPIE